MQSPTQLGAMTKILCMAGECWIGTTNFAISKTQFSKLGKARAKNYDDAYL
jgi:hypothetical protein